jgi:hypothetical protein
MKKITYLIACVSFLLLNQFSYAQEAVETTYPKLEKLQAELKLSPEQTTSLKSIMKERKLQLRALESKDESISLQSKEELKESKLKERMKKREINENFRSQLNEILNLEQQKKFDEMISEGKTKMIRHKHEHGEEEGHTHKKGHGHKHDHKHENQLEHKVIKDSHN